MRRVSTQQPVLGAVADQEEGRTQRSLPLECNPKGPSAK